MDYSNKLNLKDFFDALSKEIYCVIKLGEDYPNYISYSDIDIFCFDIAKVANIILIVGKEYVKNQNCRIELNTVSENQIQIDFYFDNSKKLDFKFDLYQAFGAYKKINIKESLFVSIIENRVLNEKNIYVPAKIDDLLLRYIEYVEFYDIRADKIKHVEYIKNKATEEELQKMLDKLHYFTAMPNVSDGEKNSKNPAKQSFKAFWKQFKHKPFKTISYIFTGKF